MFDAWRRRRNSEQTTKQMPPVQHPTPGTTEYRQHVEEEIEHFSSLFREGEGRETLHQPIPPSWQEAERRAAMLVHEKTGGFLNEHVERQLGLSSEPRLLSLGSGPAGMEIGFAEKLPHANVVCMDLNPGLLNLGRERAKTLNLNMEFFEADLNTIDLPERAFDVVYCAASLHHVIELERLAREIVRTLRPGGRLITVDVITRNGYLMWPETRDVVRSIWKTLPSKFRVNHTAYGTPRVDDEIWEADTSQHGMECVRSGDILGVIEQNFAVERYVPYFSISRRLVDTMYGPNYDLQAKLDGSIFDWIWSLDRHYLETGQLKPETFFGIYLPKAPR